MDTDKLRKERIEIIDALWTGIERVEEINKQIIEKEELGPDKKYEEPENEYRPVLWGLQGTYIVGRIRKGENQLTRL